MFVTRISLLTSLNNIGLFKGKTTKCRHPVQKQEPGDGGTCFKENCITL
jgi:hypothetical protein